MREQLEARLKTLKAEYEKGQQQLRQMESVRETMLRISGAIAVLEDLLSTEPAASNHREPATPEDGVPASPVAAGRNQP